MPSGPTVATKGTERRMSCVPVASMHMTMTLMRHETLGAWKNAVDPLPKRDSLAGGGSAGSSSFIPSVSESSIWAARSRLAGWQPGSNSWS